MPSASAISFSPFGHGRSSALASVELDRPALRETAASDVPFFLSPADASLVSPCSSFHNVIELRIILFWDNHVNGGYSILGYNAE